MEDQACPKCKTTFFRNPNMKLLVNVCGHNLCESCVDLLFVRGKIILLTWFNTKLIFHIMP